MAAGGHHEHRTLIRSGTGVHTRVPLARGGSRRTPTAERSLYFPRTHHTPLKSAGPDAGLVATVFGILVEKSGGISEEGLLAVFAAETHPVVTLGSDCSLVDCHSTNWILHDDPPLPR
jgi:hypothetical protein